VLPVLLLLSISVFFLISQFNGNQLFFYDANGYQAIADQIRVGGGAFAIAGNDLRAYFYPSLLSIAQLFGANLGIPFFVSTFLFQTGVYLWVVWYLQRGIKSLYGPAKAFTATLLMSLNFFVAPYFSVSLTDSLYNSFALALIFWAWFQLAKPENGTLWPGFLFFSLALAIRPAAVWLVAPLLLTTLFLLKEKKGGIRLAKDIPLAIIGTAPIIWQSLINLKNFGVFSPFPVQDLGGGQINGGLTFVKYSTWTGPGHPSNYYSSASIIGEYDGSGLAWYLANPLEAVQLLFFKFIGAFDFDYLVPYANSEYELSWLTSTISFSIVLAALFLIFRHLFGRGDLTGLGPRWFPILVLISWGSISMLSMLELRYTLPIITYFLLVTIWFPSEFKSLTFRGRVLVALYFFSGLYIFWTSALFVRSLALIG